MGTISLSIPQTGQPNSTEDPKIASDFTTLQTVINGNLDGSNVAATLTGRRQVMQAPFFVIGNTSSNPWLSGAADSLASGSNTTNRGIVWAYLDPANFAVTGKSNTQLIVRMSCATNGVAPATNFTGGLFPVTFSGGTGTITITAGTIVTGSSVTISTPSASSTAVAETAAFTFPAAGAYALGVGPTGATAANSGQAFFLQLFALNS